MLDLISVAMSCGIQGEMDTVRKTTGDNVLNSEQEVRQATGDKTLGL